MKEKTKLNAAVVMGVCAIMLGCHSYRDAAVATVKDVGEHIATKHKYRLNHVSHYFEGLDDSDFMRVLESQYPHVFSDRGIPFVLNHDMGGAAKAYNKYNWLPQDKYGCLTVLTLGIFPTFRPLCLPLSFDLVMVDDENVKSSFECIRMCESASAAVPTGLIPLGDAPECDGFRVFWRGEKIIGESAGNARMIACCNLFNTRNPLKMMITDDFSRKAFAYGVVAKLKELEDGGKIDDLLQRREAAKSKAPAHKVVRFARESGNDFTYGFTLELAEMPADPDKASAAVMKEFGESVKEEYIDSFPGVKKESLVVNYVDIRVDGKIVQGRVVVLTIVPTSLTYDANTRRGKLAVRFNAGQAEEARAWIRKNIETLTRDKNIALKTGTLPPEATYYSLGEKIEGNVMEIEFRTE